MCSAHLDFEGLFSFLHLLLHLLDSLPVDLHFLLCFQGPPVHLGELHLLVATLQFLIGQAPVRATGRVSEGLCGVGATKTRHRPATMSAYLWREISFCWYISVMISYFCWRIFSWFSIRLFSLFRDVELCSSSRYFSGQT